MGEVVPPIPEPLTVEEVAAIADHHIALRLTKVCESHEVLRAMLAEQVLMHDEAVKRADSHYQSVLTWVDRAHERNTRVGVVTEVLRALVPYLRHHVGCLAVRPAQPDDNDMCSCGLNEAVSTFGGRLVAQVEAQAHERYDAAGEGVDRAVGEVVPPIPERVSVKRFGWACLVGFMACIFLANYAIQHWGTVPFPGGPHTVSILWWTAPSGVLFVGLSFSLRDGAQMALGKWHILAAIVVGAVLSYFVAPSLAWASGCAFLLGEGFDWAVYTPLVERGKVTAAIVASNTVGAAIDTTVFLWLAFHSLDFWAGQFWLKTLMILPALLVVIPMRRRAVLLRNG